MNLNELASAAQSLPMADQKLLIKTLFEQLPKPSSLAGSVVQVGDLEAGRREINLRIEASLRASAEALSAKEPEPFGYS